MTMTNTKTETPSSSARARDRDRDRLDALLVDQANDWREGRPRLAEEYLAEAPDLAADPDARLDLAYGELRARRHRGEDFPIEALAQRFPDLRDDLLRQVEVGCWAEDEGDALRAEARRPTSEALGVSCDMFVAPEPADAPLSAADFVLGEALGSGGMGTVFRAHQVSLGKPVALKVLRGRACESLDAVRRLLAEGKAAARLRHPRIVGVHGIGRFPDGSPFLVMDLVEGPSLAERLLDGPFAPEEAAEIAADVADALEHAHGRGVVHRDLKPSNVLIDPEGRPLVTDFGLAKRFDADAPALTRTDQILGTPHYMAPEQADRRWGPVGPRTDVYGLGALLFALLSGRPPFQGDSSLEVLSRVASTEPAPRLSTLRPDLPESLTALCGACLSKDPSRRPNSAAEVAEALRYPGVAAVLPAKDLAEINDDWDETPPPPPLPAYPRRTGTAAMILLPLAIVLLTVLGVTVYWAVEWPARQPSPQAVRKAPALPEPPEAPDAPPIVVSPPVANATLAPRPLPPPPAPAPVEVTWHVVREREGQSASPIDDPAPLVVGDRLQLDCRLSRPALAYLFWLKGDGTVRRLAPVAASSLRPVERVEVPEELADALAIEEPAGTEYFVLIATDNPPAAATVEGWEKELAIFRPLGNLDDDSVLIDGRPAGPEPRAEPHPAISRALLVLPGRIEPKGAKVSTLALPHAEPAP